MKKLVASKVKCYPQRTLECPKPLICNNWRTRNDSASVHAILHPDLQVRHTRKQIKNVSEEPTGKKSVAYKKHFKSSNSCYCKEKGLQPSLLKRPNKCLTLEGLEQTLKTKSVLSDLSKARKSLHCLCKGFQDSPEQIDFSKEETLKKIQEEINELRDELQLTDKRKNYETYREAQHADYLREIEEYYNQSGNDTEDVQTLLGTATFCPQSSRFAQEGVTGSEINRFGTLCDNAKSIPQSSNLKSLDNFEDDGSFSTKSKTTRNKYSANHSNEESGIDFEQMRKFRDENYFETHQVDEFVSTDIPEHTCVYQYRLDHRLLPQAVNLDRYGKSRCTICSKPMKESNLDQAFFTDNITWKKVKNFGKCLDMGLLSHDVNIGSSERIELRVNMDDIIRRGTFIGSYRRPCNTNTFALRQQKMNTWKFK